MQQKLSFGQNQSKTFKEKNLNGHSVVVKNSVFLDFQKNCIDTENKIFFNPLIFRNKNLNGKFKMEEDLNSRFDKKVKFISFCLKKVNTFKKMKRIKPYKKTHSFDFLKFSQRLGIQSLIKQGKKIKKKRRSRRTSCNCKSTFCIKLYCECFSSKGYCSKHCKCLDCKNNPDFQEERTLKIIEIEKRNPLAFIPKEYKHNSLLYKQKMMKKSCSCKKSSCTKKYCDCFNKGSFCNPLCKCSNCSNFKK